MAQVGDVWVFRWHSGDEFGLLCAASDSLCFAPRVNRPLQEDEMTATFDIAPVVSNDLEASMSRAASLVQDTKARGIRGAIYQLWTGHGERQKLSNQYPRTLAPGTLRSLSKKRHTQWDHGGTQ